MTKVEALGINGCSALSPCEDGQGDCDNDNECFGNLHCFKRQNGELRDGYDFSNANLGLDVCVRRILLFFLFRQGSSPPAPPPTL